MVSMQVIGKLMKSWKECGKFFFTLLLKGTYIRSSIAGKLSQRFSGTRWVENEDSAEKVILVWPDIVAFTKHLALCPSKRPKNNKSFGKFAQSVNDKLMIIKLTFFEEVAHILNEFLWPFQTDNPMVPI